MLEFKRLKKTDRDRFDEVVKKYYYQNAESSFASLYLWSEGYDIKAAFGEHALHLSFVDLEGRKVYLAPFLYDMSESIEEAFDELRDYLHHKERTFCIKGVVSDVRKKIENDLKTEFEFFEDRDNYEYIYRSEDLMNLTGKKYSAKRNHINYFLNNYEFEYRRYDKSLKEECLDHIEGWVGNKGEVEGLDEEINVLKKTLDEYDELGIIGAVVFVDGKIEALTFGEALNKDTALIHIEKANPNIRGLYPFINREFVRNEWSEFEYINREEDMGLEGLRKAKLSYNPIYLLEKYSCSVDGDCDGI